MSARTAPVAGVAALLAAVAIGCAFASDAMFPRGQVPHPWIAVGFFALLTVSEFLVLSFRFRDEIMALSLLEAILAPALLVLAGPAVIVLVAVAKATAEALHRVPPLKAAFNVAQLAAGAGIGAVVMEALRDGSGLSARNVGAVVAALTALALVNLVAFTAVIGIVQRRSVREVLAIHAPTFAFGWTINSSFGVLFAAAYSWSAWTLVLLAIPLAFLHVAYRGYAAAVADEARLSGMHRASRALATPLDPKDAISGFLAEVREAFHADVASLVLLEPTGQVVHRARAGDAPGYDRRHEPGPDPLTAAVVACGQTIRVDDRDTTLGPALAQGGHRVCVAAPLVSEGRAMGVLYVFDRSGLEGFEDGEVAVLQALANEAAATLGKGAVLERLLEERRKLSQIVNRTSDGIATISRDGRVLTWNPGMAAFTGHVEEDARGRRIDELLRPRSADDHEVFFDRWSWRALPSDVQIVTQTGEQRWLSCSYSTIPDASNQPATMIVVARDVTQIREVEKLREDFVATVSHELRTPLTPIKGWADTLVRLGDRMLPEQRAEAARSILRQAEGLERVILNLLEVSRIERGIIDLRDAVTDVTAVVERLVDQYAVSSPQRTIVVHADPSRARAQGDDVCISQIVSNLLGNAIKYSAEDQPIEVTIERVADEVVVSVRDHGAGIPPHALSRIFERFQRVDGAERPQAGTGLGLYIARALAQAIGARLSVESTPGVGSTFSVAMATENVGYAVAG